MKMELWEGAIWEMAQSDIIQVAKKAADMWRNTDTYHQAAQIIDVLVSELENKPAIPKLDATPPCYQPDGDGCAYQCYDGDDEPIDKCKECPLCYSDKQRHRAALKEPLKCTGCFYLDEQCAPCAHCIRATGYADYYRIH